MQITDVKTYDDIAWEDYLSLPGISHSFAKNNGARIDETDNMRLGTAVDRLIFEPKKYDGYRYEVVKPLANRVISVIGKELLARGRRQMTITCKMHWKGYVMSYKGRPDFFFSFVLDLKVSKLNLLQAIKFFGYDNQLSGYAMPLKSKQSLILSINPITKLISTLPIPTRPDWWREQVLKYGEAA